VEARDVGVAEVDLGVAVRHPLGDGAGGARTLLDPHRGGRPQALDLGRLTEEGVAVGGQREQPVDGVADLGALVAEELGHELERLLELRVEVVLGERQLGGGELALLDGGDVLRVPEDGAVGVGADLHVRAVLALVAEGVHVANDRVADLTGTLGEHLARADRDHLVHRRGEGDARAGHAGDLGAPDTARDDDRLRLDAALGGLDRADATLDHLDARDLDVRDGRQGALLDGALAHDGAGAQAVDDADGREPGSTDDDARVEERDLLDDLLGGDQFGGDAPGLGAAHPAAQFLHALLGARDLVAAGLGEDAQLLVLAHGVQRDVGELARVVDREDEVARVARGATGVGQRALVELDDVGPAELGQVVGERVPDDAGADDDAAAEEGREAIRGVLSDGIRGAYDAT
jgi:hypothetical protein